MPTQNVKDFSPVNIINLSADSILSIKNGDLVRLNAPNAALSGVNLLVANNLNIGTGVFVALSGDFYDQLRVFNATGLNSGEFGVINWNNNRLIIGSTQSQSGILRDLVLTGKDININASGQLNIFDNTNISGNLTVSGTGIFAAIDLNNIDSLALSGMDITITNANVLVNTNNTIIAPNLVYNTGDQTISGTKNFISRPNVNSTGVAISGQFLNALVTLTHANQTPANGGQTYYFAQRYDAALVTNTTDRRFVVPRDCVIKHYTLQIQNFGSFGAGTTSVTYDIYNATDGQVVPNSTLYTCTNCHPYNQVFSGHAMSNVNIPLSSGKQYAVRWVFNGGYSSAIGTVNNQVNLFLE